MGRKEHRASGLADGPRFGLVGVLLGRPGTDTADRLSLRGGRIVGSVIGHRGVLTVVGAARDQTRLAQKWAGHENRSQEDGDDRFHGGPNKATGSNIMEFIARHTRGTEGLCMRANLSTQCWRTAAGS